MACVKPYNNNNNNGLLHNECEFSLCVCVFVITSKMPAFATTRTKYCEMYLFQSEEEEEESIMTGTDAMTKTVV